MTFSRNGQRFHQGNVLDVLPTLPAGDALVLTEERRDDAEVV